MFEIALAWLATKGANKLITPKKKAIRENKEIAAEIDFGMDILPSFNLFKNLFKGCAINDKIAETNMYPIIVLIYHKPKNNNANPSNPNIYFKPFGMLQM